MGSNSPLLFSDPTGTVVVNEVQVSLDQGLATANVARCGAFSLLIGAGLFFSDTRFGLSGSLAGDSSGVTAILGAGAFFTACSAAGVGQAVTIRVPLQSAKIGLPAGGLDKLLFYLGKVFGKAKYI